MAFHSPMIVGVNVLLVDSDMDFLLQTATMLQFYSFEGAQEVSSAYSLLYKGDIKFDVAIIDLNLSGCKFMREAINMGLTVILTATNTSAVTVKCAIEDGAFLVMEKPISSETIKYLWQHVLREKSRKSKPPIASRKAQAMTTMKRNPSNAYKVTSQRERVEYINFDNSTKNINTAEDMNMRPKLCIEWTPELHKKFMDAVGQLQNGRCFPKDILEIMNVPGLTRMQVASHLQKCRHAFKRQASSREASSTSDPKAYNRPKPKRFGIVPPPIIEDSTPHESPLQVEQHPSNNTEASSLSSAQNMAQQGDHNLNNNPTNSNMYEMIPNENYGHLNITVGNLEPEPELETMIETGASFDFGISDDHGQVTNNIDDFQPFDYDYRSYASQISNEVVDIEDPSFWSLWTTNSAGN